MSQINSRIIEHSSRGAAMGDRVHGGGGGGGGGGVSSGGGGDL